MTATALLGARARALDVSRVGPIACVALLLMLAAGLTDRVFSPEFSPVGPLGAVVVSAVVAMAVQSRSLIGRFLAHAAAVGVSTSVMVFAHGGEFPADVFASITSGLGDVVTSRWPAPVTQTSAGATVFTVALASSLGTELARSRRFAAGLLIAPAALALLFAALSAPAGAPTSLFAAGFASVSALTLRQASLARAERRHGPPPDARRRVGTVVAVLAALVGFIPLAIGRGAGDDRFDLRDAADGGVVVTESVSPLTRLEEIGRLDSGEALFTVSTTSMGTTWRFVTLDRYDGFAWMPGDDFRPIGSVVGSTDAPTNAYVVTIGSLREKWIPTLGGPVNIDVSSATDDRRGGFYLTRETRGDERFEIIAQQPSLGVEHPSRAIEVSNSQMQATLLSAVPDEIKTLATEITQGANGDAERALRLAEWIRSNVVEDEEAPAGHTYAQIRQTLRSRSGSLEQLVATYALLADSVGLPVRIAVGGSLSPAGAGVLQAAGADVTAWPEIAFGNEWARIDVVPAEDSEPAVGPGATPAERPAPKPPIAKPIDDVDPETDNPPPPEPDYRSSIDWWVLAPAAVALVSVVALAIAVSRVPRQKRKRRLARRSDEDPVRQVVGAFRESVDQLVDLGYSPMHSQTDREVALERDRNAFGDREALSALATMATAATYSGVEPPAPAVERAWELAELHVRAVEEQTGVSGRVRTRLSPRSLRSRW